MQKSLSVIKEQIVGDLAKGSLKAKLVLKDGLKIETVLMAYRSWLTACVSTMVGCPLNCLFCATGKMGFKRNLTAEEIIDQVNFWNEYLTKPAKVSRIVYMGMGEPFLNWDEVLKSTKEITKIKDLNISQAKITISTVGIVPKIYEFSDLKTKMNLAVSLHSPFQEKRFEIMPIAKKYPLNDLINACKYYVQKNKRELFFEYALIERFNDNKEDVRELKKIFALSPFFHLNLIVLNDTKCGYKGSGMGRREYFTHSLENFHIPFSFRRSVGREIDAACGQLIIKL